MAGGGTKLFRLTNWAIKLGYVAIVAFAVIALVVFAVLTNDPGAGIVVGELGQIDRAEADPAIKAMLIAGQAMSIPLLFVLRNLQKILASAMICDPFVVENAARLRRIGWLMLAVNIIQALSTGIYALLAHEAVGTSTPLPIPWAGLFTVLLIFVIARIFQHGSEMRADLEGTV